jgi:WD40 repeat protein
MSEDARFIYVSLEKDFIISKFNLDDRKMELDFNKAHKDNIFSLKLFHNGIKLISGSADMRIIIWSVSNGQI